MRAAAGAYPRSLAAGVPVVRRRDADHRLNHLAVAIRRILDHLGEPTSPPRLRPARGPPLWEMIGVEPDQTDPQAQPAPDCEFDQRIAWWGNRRTDSLFGGDLYLRSPERQTSAAQVASGIDNRLAGAGFQGRSVVFGAKFTIDSDGNGLETSQCGIEISILDKLFGIGMMAKPQALLFEAANPHHAHEWRVFAQRKRKIPDDKIPIPGVISSTSNYIEHPELIAERIERFAGIVGRERVMAGSDCGFSTFAGDGLVDPEICFANCTSRKIAGNKMPRPRQKTSALAHHESL